jgi:hypothetical protein
MKVKIPLVNRTVGGFPCPRPRVTLQVGTRYGYAALKFYFDTGADLVTVPITLARHEGIEFPESEATRGVATGLVGATTKYRGTIRVRIRRDVFVWPCDFLVGSATATAAEDYYVLGRAGFLREFAACVDDEYFKIRRRFRDRPWWYRAARRLWPVVSRLHPADQPL